jgi:hypothetical protein
LPAANENSNGYLTKEDWRTFSGRTKQARVWQYQDFAGPVGSSLKLTKFENGGDAFDPARIVDNSAVVAELASPERLIYAGGMLDRLLKKNHLLVTSHSKEQVVLDAEVGGGGCRVWFLTLLSPTANLDRYTAAPKNIRNVRIELINASDIDGAGPRRILGDKVFVGDVSTEGKVGIKNANPMADLDVGGSLKTNSFTMAAGAAHGYVLTSNNIGQAAWGPSPVCQSTPPQYPYDGQLWVKNPDYELFVYDAGRKKWIGTSTLQLDGAKNSSSATNGYLDGPASIPMSYSSLVLPFDAILVSCNASSQNDCSWSAEIHSNGKQVSGAQVICSAAGKVFDNSLNVEFKAGQQVSIYIIGTGISMPRVNALFKRTYI